MQKERIKALNEKATRKGRHVLYWMQASQRTECNHALEYAILKANELLEPIIVFFGITDHFPEGNERHYYFMLEGLQEVKRSLEKRGIEMVIQHGSPELGIVQIAKDASLVVVDRGYLRIQKKWRKDAAQRLNCPLIQVESDVIVPVEEASPKEEYAAATIRPKIKKKLNHFLAPLKERDPVTDSLSLASGSFDLTDIDQAISQLRIDRSVKKVNDLHGGTKEAKKHLEAFLEKKLDHYAELRNDPTLDSLSKMSPYLHFGQISPLYIVQKILEAKSPGQEAYLEELIIRRELSMNFVFYNKHYDSFDAIPRWAKKTLKAHRKDKRLYVYSLNELETTKTHDPYWNTAQKEMVFKGKMHGYMRMYWGKKILEWSKTPEDAYRNALYLNNKYEIDGRDPNGFTGIAWCFGKHDRPWGERPIFGSIRYMNDKGLKRKFDAEKYVKMMNNLPKISPLPTVGKD
ncbi:MAG: deoxyribodipyrimidine photolyase [Deltaproteobacteria bacterium RBG_16_47_11]|nr:MAG: deoxyribodipyrimidine photolyase [Deltaproteobacteria bacterium RBG_16_47_11]